MKNFIILIVTIFLFQKISFANEIQVESMDYALLDQVSKSCEKELNTLEAVVESKQNSSAAKESFDKCMDEAVKTFNR